MMRWIGIYQSKLRTRARQKDPEDMTWDIDDLEAIWDRPLR